MTLPTVTGFHQASTKEKVSSDRQGERWSRKRKRKSEETEKWREGEEENRKRRSEVYGEKKNQEEEKTGGSMKGMRGRKRGGGGWRTDLHCCIHQTTSLLFVLSLRQKHWPGCSSSYCSVQLFKHVCYLTFSVFTVYIWSSSAGLNPLFCHHSVFIVVKSVFIDGFALIGLDNVSVVVTMVTSTSERGCKRV